MPYHPSLMHNNLLTIYHDSKFNNSWERVWQHHLQFGGTESLPLHLLLRPSFKSSKWNLERKAPLNFFLTLQFESWLFLQCWRSLQKGTYGATFCPAVAWGRGMDHSLQHHQEVEQADKSETVIHVPSYGNSANISIISDQSQSKKRKTQSQ